jgi:hypothetical protein
MPAPTPPAAPAKLSVWRKLLTHRRQHWVIRELNDLDRVRRDCCEQAGHSPSPYWLLPYRATFRKLIRHDAAPALRYYLADCPTEMTPLAVWLLGRTADRFRLYGLEEFAYSRSPLARRHAARALRRLEAWPHLESIARRYPNDRRLQWYARASIIKRPHAERLRNFAGHVDATHAAAAKGPSRMPLWFKNVDWIRRPPKTAAYIRHLLQHLHGLIRG